MGLSVLLGMVLFTNGVRDTLPSGFRTVESGSYRVRSVPLALKLPEKSPTRSAAVGTANVCTNELFWS